MPEPAIPTPVEAVQALNDAASIAGTTTERFANAAQTLGEILSKYAGEYSGLLAASVALDTAAAAKSSELYKDYVRPFEQAALIPRQLVAELTGASVLGLSEISTTAKALRDQSYKEQQQMISEKVNVGGEGAKAFILPLTSFYKDASELGKAFIEGALGDSRLYSAGMRALSETNSLETKKISAFTAKGLGLDSREMRAIYQEEFSKTGQITGDFVEKFSATVLAAEKVTGLSNRALSEDMKRMVFDVENFGNITNAKMASLSNTMHQLGIDILDVTSVAGKFASFDSATTAISNLSAVTGATLDTMELFYLANEDKEEFFRSLRQQLIDQGVSLENLSHQEQVYLSKQLGFSSVRQLQSLLNEDIELTSENMSEMIESAAEGSEFQGKNLEDLLTKTAGFAKDTIAAMEPGALKASLESVKALSGGTNEYAESIIAVNKNMAKYAVEGIPEFAAAGQIFATSISTSMSTAVTSMAAFKRFFVEFSKDGGGAAAFVNAVDEIMKPFRKQSMPPIWAKPIDGLELFKSVFVGILDSTATDAATKTKNLLDAVTNNMKSSIMSTATSFAELREKSKAEIAKIDKEIADAKVKVDEKDKTTFESKIKALAERRAALQAETAKSDAIEKQAALDAVKIENEAGDLTKRFKDYARYDPVQRAKLLQQDFGGGEGQALTNDNVAKLTAALENQDIAGGSQVLVDAIAALNTRALSAATAIAPAAPQVPAAAEATAAATTAAAAAATVRGPTTATGDMAIKVKIDFDMSELNSMIKTSVEDAITGNIRITEDKVASAGVGSAGEYKIAFVKDPATK
jgi:hypothetical protein